QAEDGIRDGHVTGVQTCALPIYRHHAGADGAQEHNREVDGVEHDHGDALFAANAETAQQIGEASRLYLQIAIGQLRDRIGEGELAAAALIDIAVKQPSHGVVRTRRAAHDASPQLQEL